MENIGDEETVGVVGDFRRIYRRMAKDKGGEALFGKAGEKMASVLRRGSIRNAGEYGFYFEFPFTGAPRADLMIQYLCAKLPDTVTFEEGDGYGFRPFFASLAADADFAYYIAGFSFDISDMTEKNATDSSLPGIYLLPHIHRANAAYVSTMLERLGGGERIPGVMAAFAAAPKRWRPYYAGYMPGRRGSPVRIGFWLSREVRKLYAEDPKQLTDALWAYAPQTISHEGRKILERLTDGCGIIDLQFDVFPDGSISDSLGVSLDFHLPDVDPRKSAGFLAAGKAGKKMDFLQSLGLADDRRHLMDSVCCGVRCLVPYQGRHLKVADIVRLNAVKVRFKGGMPHLAKGYLYAQSVRL